MSYTLISIPIALLAGVAIFLTLRRVGRDALGVRSALVWIVLWLAIALISLFPGILDGLLSLSGMQNRVSFALICSVLVLFATLYAQSARLQSMDRDIARLIRHLALVRFQHDNPELTKRAAKSSTPDEPSETAR